jgi:hypothetical protein
LVNLALLIVSPFQFPNKILFEKMSTQNACVPNKTESGISKSLDASYALPINYQ